MSKLTVLDISTGFEFSMQFTLLYKGEITSFIVVTFTKAVIPSLAYTNWYARKTVSITVEMLTAQKEHLVSAMGRMEERVNGTSGNAKNAATWGTIGPLIIESPWAKN